MSQERFDIELLAGDLPAAEAVLREACATLEELGEKGFLSTRAALSRTLPRAAGPSQRGRTVPRAGRAVMTETKRRSQPRPHWHEPPRLSRGSLSEAEDHARQALAAIADWDHPNFKGDSLVQLADILRAAGRADEAVAAYSEALALYEQKENLVAAGRVSRSLALLQAETGTHLPVRVRPGRDRSGGGSHPQVRFTQRTRVNGTSGLGARQFLAAVALPPFRPAAFFWAVVPP